MLLQMFGVMIWTFNSRPHKEVDVHDAVSDIRAESFNSRPHKEVDAGSESGAFNLDLSIHDLTRRSTSGFMPENMRSNLSIHDLTRRSCL